MGFPQTQLERTFKIRCIVSNRNPTKSQGQLALKSPRAIHFATLIFVFVRLRLAWTWRDPGSDKNATSKVVGFSIQNFRNIIWFDLLCYLSDSFQLRLDSNFVRHLIPYHTILFIHACIHTYIQTYINYITLHYINYIPFHSITLHYINYITLHYITLHCITLHYITLITLHYITLR